MFTLYSSIYSPKNLKNCYQKGTFLAKNTKNGIFWPFFSEKPTVRGILGQSWQIISAGKLFYALFMHWYVFAQLSGNILNLKGTFSRKMSTKTRFFHNVSHQDWVTLDQSRQFIASQPFQCLNMSMMNGCARLRFEFILYNHHHTTAFESRVVTI